LGITHIPERGEPIMRSNMTLAVPRCRLLTSPPFSLSTSQFMTFHSPLFLFLFAAVTLRCPGPACRGSMRSCEGRPGEPTDRAQLSSGRSFPALFPHQHRRAVSDPAGEVFRAGVRRVVVSGWVFWLTRGWNSILTWQLTECQPPDLGRCECERVRALAGMAQRQAKRKWPHVGFALFFALRFGFL
jgi:hypothetical protein